MFAADCTASETATVSFRAGIQDSSCPLAQGGRTRNIVNRMDETFEELKIALADQYELESAVGAGGMAVVYLARDLKHDRNVAIKVLRPDLSASLGAERFLREIQIAAKLSHPHILPLYDSGEADGHLFYVMPFIEGESLRDLIDRETQLGLEDAVKIASEVAEALSLAHSYGVVHRDIKPENIMLTGGHAVVADFGIARAVGVSGGSDLTQAGTAIGTPAYMSPEQAAGDPSVDGRTDVYSLGCVLYEMLVGQIPFTGPTAQAIIARHTMDHITPPHIMRETVSEELEDVIVCAMSKSPADRFKTAGEMSEALKALASGAPTYVRKSTMLRRPITGEVVIEKKRSPLIPALVGAAIVVILGVLGWQLWPTGGGGAAVDGGPDPTSIAVLYLEDLSSDRSLGHIADGLTEALIADLSRVQALDVRSKGAVDVYRNTDVRRDSVARALEVGTLIVGGVDQSGDTFRFTVQLADASGLPYKQEEFDWSATDVLLVRDSVAQEVSNLLRAQLGDEVQLRSRREETSSTEAWSLVQRGEGERRNAESLFDEDDMEAGFGALDLADSLFATAEMADPTWIEPIVLRGWVAHRRAALAEEPEQADEWVAIGLTHAARALALDSTDAKALEIRGTLRYDSWYFGPEPEPEVADALLDGAKADLRAAVLEDRGLARAYSNLSLIHYLEGERAEANLAALNAYEADAYLRNARGILWRLFQTSYDMENFTEAIRWCDEGQRRFPEDDYFVACQLWMLTTRVGSTNVDSAWGLLAELERLLPEFRHEYYGREGQMLVAAAIARAGLADSARNVLVRARATPDIDPDRALMPLETFIRAHYLGDTDEAIRIFREFMVHNPHHRDEETQDVHWWYRPLQDDPRYQELMRPTG